MVLVRAALQDDVDFFCIDNIELLDQINSPLRKWAIDLEGKVFLAKLGAGREDSSHEQYFIMNFHGESIELTLANRRDGDFRYWELINCNPDMADKETSQGFLPALKGCLVAWDEFYAGTQSKFKF